MKPWPGDAIMIVCETFGRETRDNMESVVEVECRDCHQKLGADSKTIRLAEETPVRRGRPIKFFCVPCCMTYDPSSVTHYADHSAAQDGGTAIVAANPSAVN